MHKRAPAVAYDARVNNRATPKGMLITVAFLALYCAFAIWFGWTHRDWLIVAIGLLAGLACVGAANMLRWSRFLVYALSIAFAFAWLSSIYVAARVGYFSVFPWLTIIMSLMPGSVLLAVACFCSRMAYRHLGQPPVMAAPGT